MAALRYYNTVRQGPRFYVVEHVPGESGGRRLFTAESLEHAVHFLLQKAYLDGLVPFDVAYEKLAETLIEERSYRDAAYAYTILEADGPAAYNN